jgi:hypothetical protein
MFCFSSDDFAINLGKEPVKVNELGEDGQILGEKLDVLL